MSDVLLINVNEGVRLNERMDTRALCSVYRVNADPMMIMMMMMRIVVNISALHVSHTPKGTLCVQFKARV